ncbi:protein CREG1 isoform X1 [Drosophila takahashii]|uniref:protein CREG1 isoform X1 n=2 Tax=Drosophila takahashii TaxID=29030 RepID=UPI001CF8F862|nr:protein CREG1 isoform X2 [Drosophila takahashii]
MPCSRSFSCPVISDLSKPNRYTCSPAMKPCPSILLALILAITIPSTTFGYSPREDARVISEYKRNQDLNHAKIARDLVHRANWGALGSLSTDKLVQGYPMVNIISIDDSDANDNSTGRIHFLLTDLDFTGPDWQKDNKVTFLFSDEQTLRCKDGGKDPMEPTCARSMISGQVKKMDPSDSSYQPALDAYLKRHPAASNWIKVHNFYLCELEISNIFVLDFYGGPHKVSPSDYYAVSN